MVFVGRECGMCVRTGVRSQVLAAGAGAAGCWPGLSVHAVSGLSHVVSSHGLIWASSELGILMAAGQLLW